MAAAIAALTDRRVKLKSQAAAEESMASEVKEEDEMVGEAQTVSGATASAASGEDEASEEMDGGDVDVEEEGDEEEDDERGALGSESVEDQDEDIDDAESASLEDQSAAGPSGEEGEASEEEHEVVGAVKLPQADALPSEVEEGSESGSDESGADEENDVGVSVESTSVSAVEDWEDASAGEAEMDVAGRNNCIFCKLGEDEDPSEEFEEYLACAVCGDNAHQQCAHEEDSLDPNTNPKEWNCPTCMANKMGSQTTHSPKNRRESTASQVPKELLPAPRGSTKPGSHSIFDTLIIEEDPNEGARSLRKRKSSSAAPDGHSISSTKRQKRGSRSGSADASTDTPPSRPTSKRQSTAGEPEADLKTSSRQRSAAATSQGTSARPRRQKVEPNKVRTLIKEGSRLLMAIKVDLSRIKQTAPQKTRRPSLLSTSHTRFSHIPTTHCPTPLYSLHGQETDESKKPYGGILTEAEADTSKTFPSLDDRTRFDDAKRQYEEEWAIKTAAQEAESELKGRASTKISGPPSKIKCISFGGYEIDTWYAAPYPEEYSRNRVLFICEFCLKYMPSDYVAWRHKLKCPAKHPPGDEIYRHKSISVFEVDGRKNPVYCQNLCLLAKLFLGSKTLYYDVEPFLFYIMTEYDELGYHFVGYFSKEKRPSSMNNVSCILTLPIHQRKGYGNLLIDFSYLLTRVEQKTGSPEKPLSDMGLVSYRNYWRLVLAQTLLEQREPLSIAKIADQTGMTPDDIIAALEALRAMVRDPVTKTYALRIDRPFLRETIEKWEAKKYVSLNPDALIWTPYIMGRNNLASYDRGAPISTVAPREDEEDNPATSTAVPEEGVQAQIAQEVKAAAAEAVATNADANGAASGLDAGHLPNGAMSATGSTKTEAVPPAATPMAATTNPMSTASANEETSSGLATNNLPGKDSAGASSPKPNGVQLGSVSIDASRAPSPQKPGYPIPPTRYEIYPPIPGFARRRANRRPSTAGTPTGTGKSRNRRPNSPATLARRLGNGGGGAGTPGIVVPSGEGNTPSAGALVGPTGSAPGTPFSRALNGLAPALDPSVGTSTGATTPNGRRTRSSGLISKPVEEDELARALAGTSTDGAIDTADAGSGVVTADEGGASEPADGDAADKGGIDSVTANQAAFAANASISTSSNGNIDEGMDAEGEDEGNEEELGVERDGEGLEGQVVANMPMVA